MSKENKIIIHEGIIASKIVIIRNEKVILDFHLAELYEVETRALKQAVRRNISRFPDDFMYELTETEVENMVSQNVIPSKKHFGGAAPFAFTESGVAMLSSVLNSKKALEVNIAIMRTFTKLRKLLSTHQDILKKFEQLETRLSNHDDQFMLIFEYLKQFEEAKQQHLEQANRRKIGYHNSED